MNNFKSAYSGGDGYADSGEKASTDAKIGTGGDVSSWSGLNMKGPPRDKFKPKRKIRRPTETGEGPGSNTEPEKYIDLGEPVKAQKQPKHPGGGGAGDSDGIYAKTSDVAAAAGVHKNTILRWLEDGTLLEPKRDEHGCRRWTTEQKDAAIAKAKSRDDKASSKKQAQISPDFAVEFAARHGLLEELTQRAASWLERSLGVQIGLMDATPWDQIPDAVMGRMLTNTVTNYGDEHAQANLIKNAKKKESKRCGICAGSINSELPRVPGSLCSWCLESDGQEFLWRKLTGSLRTAVAAKRQHG